MPVAYSENLNHGRFETWTIKPEMDFHHVKQVHGIDIVPLKDLPCDADGMLVSWNELTQPLAIKTADCMPIVIEGEKGVVHLHAGWRGLAHGILLREEIKKIIPQRVLIGPSIHACCFEVSPEFKENFPKSSNFSQKDGKLFFNLQTEAREVLLKEFPNLLIHITPLCTHCDIKFHSYRRGKHTIERNWNLYIKG
jgi:copper oxidase (laccase) domain-containing protein